MRDAPGLIIDLRGNGGGDDSVAIKLANHLFDRPTQLMITRTRKGESKYYRARPTEHPYLGPVAILIDEGSASASEQLTAGLQELGRAYVIGKKTKGEDMDADAVKLPTGAYFVYAAGEPRTPKGVVIEGRGVIPELEVSLTRAELLKGNDAQLSAAIQYIKEKEKRILAEKSYHSTSMRDISRALMAGQTSPPRRPGTVPTGTNGTADRRELTTVKVEGIGEALHSVAHDVSRL